MTSTGEAD